MKDDKCIKCGSEIEDFLWVAFNKCQSCLELEHREQVAMTIGGILITVLIGCYIFFVLNGGG